MVMMMSVAPARVVEKHPVVSGTRRTSTLVTKNNRQALATRSWRVARVQGKFANRTLRVGSAVRWTQHVLPWMAKGSRLYRVGRKSLAVGPPCGVGKDGTARH